MAGLIVHEWFEASGGAEQVVRAMFRTFPDADLVCAWADDGAQLPELAERPGRPDQHGRHGQHGTRVRQTWLARTPLRRHKALAVPALLAAWAGLRTDVDYDWVLASSHLFAHHADPGRRTDAPHLAYVYTPARYIWAADLDTRGGGAAVRAAAAPLRAWDARRARRLDGAAAISEFIRERIARCWGIDAEVIYPPVETARITAVADWSQQLTEAEHAVLSALPDGFVLGASRFVPYKRLDVAIRVGEATGVPVVLAGSGPLRAELAARADQATVPVHLVDRPSDALLFALYQRASVFVFPPIEDFGIMPVEAMAAGTPVIANAVGGTAETVRDGITGALVGDFESATLRAAYDVARSADRDACRAQAEQFSAERFDAALAQWVQRAAAA